MTPEERAREIVTRVYGPLLDNWPNGLANSISFAIKAAVAEERRACAEVAERMANEGDWSDDHSIQAHAADKRARFIAKAIRERG